MNCKPGDLAINVAGLVNCRGEIYKVVRPYDGPLFLDRGFAWWVDHRGQEFHCTDASLRPIRDPGDDARDEMLRPLPKQREQETGMKCFVEAFQAEKAYWDGKKTP